MDQFGQNQFAPGMKSSLFVPDQLVSGPLQLVTDSVTIGVSGELKRGTVLGVVTGTGAYIPSKKMRLTEVKSRPPFWSIT